MADGTKIEWTDATWNPITGCSVVSPGCANCYAMRLAGGRMRAHPSRAGLTMPSKAGPVWNGRVRLNEAWLAAPLRWTRPRMIFVCAHGDLFHESVPDEWIDRVVAVMALARRHTFQVLTKRAARMRDYFVRLPERLPELAMAIVDHPAGPRPLADLVDLAIFSQPLPNVWLGISAEDQRRLDERAPALLSTPAAVHYLSAEPMLGEMDLTGFIRGMPSRVWRSWSTFEWPVWVPTQTRKEIQEFWSNKWRRGPCTWMRSAIDNGQPPLGTRGAFSSSKNRPPVEGRFVPFWTNIGLVIDEAGDAHQVLARSYQSRSGYLDWVICGGESGAHGRPLNPAWVRILRDQCALAEVAFFFKQWGEFLEFGERGRMADGTVNLLGSPDDAPENWATWNGTVVTRIGKRRAGRLLDGREHSAMPSGAA